MEFFLREIFSRNFNLTIQQPLLPCYVSDSLAGIHLTRWPSSSHFLEIVSNHASFSYLALRNALSIVSSCTFLSMELAWRRSDGHFVASTKYCLFSPERLGSVKLCKCIILLNRSSRAAPLLAMDFLYRLSRYQYRLMTIRQTIGSAWSMSSF